MEKIKVYLDMDGTIADLYGIENWLPRLRASDNKIFLECEPMIDEETLFRTFPEETHDIRILSMTPKDASMEYCEDVINQKNAWLDRYFPKLQKRIYRKYGNNKNLRNSVNALLVDDSEPIRNTWKGIAINPKNLWETA